MFHILPPCHLMCTSQLGRTWLIMPVGSVTIATTPFFFFSLPDNHLAFVSSNRVARLKVLYEVKMLIFWQHTGKNTTESYEWKKVLQRSGRQAAAPSHGGPRQPDATCDTAGEEGESVYHFEIQLTPLLPRRVWQDISQWRQTRSASASKTWKNKESPRKERVMINVIFFCCLDLFGFYCWKHSGFFFCLFHKRNSWRKSREIVTLVQILELALWASQDSEVLFFNRCGLYQRNIQISSGHVGEENVLGPSWRNLQARHVEIKGLSPAGFFFSQKFLPSCAGCLYRFEKKK